MPKVAAKQVNVPNWRFSCTQCGNCCRRWHVALSAEERARLEALAWTDEDDVPTAIATNINGDPYIAHTDNGSCIYLDQDNNHCKIHSRFGFDAKPKGCRLYPYNIATTFKNEYSVIPRFDCPGVRQNRGKPIASSMTTLRHHIDDLGLHGGFDHYDLERLKDATSKKMIQGVFEHLLARQDYDARTRVIGLHLCAVRFKNLRETFLNTQIDTVIPTIFERVADDAKRAKGRRLYKFEQWRFLSLFVAFLRRDEELFGQGLKARLERAQSISRLYLGKANLRDLGSEHPDQPLSASLLFSMPIENLDEVDWSLFLDLVKLRVTSYQFFGSSCYNMDIYTGMKALALAFPMVIAAAKWSALARCAERCTIEASDVDYAVGVIDHSLGRSTLIGSPFYRMLVRQMIVEEPFIAQLDGVLYGARRRRVQAS